MEGQQAPGHQEQEEEGRAGAHRQHALHKRQRQQHHTRADRDPHRAGRRVGRGHRQRSIGQPVGERRQAPQGGGDDGA